MEEFNIDMERMYIGVFVSYFTQLYRIISVFPTEIFIYPKTQTWQKLDTFYIQLHLNLMKVYKESSTTNDLDFKKVLQSVEDSGLLNFITLESYDDFILNGMMEDCVHDMLSPTLGMIRQLSVKHRVLSNEYFGKNYQGTKEEIKQELRLKIEENKEFPIIQDHFRGIINRIDFEIGLDELINEYTKELKMYEEQFLANNAPEKKKEVLSLSYDVRNEKLSYGKKELIFKEGKGRASMIIFFDQAEDARIGMALEEIAQILEENYDDFSKERQKKMRNSIRDALKDTVNEAIKKQTENNIIDCFLIRESNVSVQYPVSFID